MPDGFVRWPDGPVTEPLEVVVVDNGPHSSQPGGLCLPLRSAYR